MEACQVFFNRAEAGMHFSIDLLSRLFHVLAGEIQHNDEEL
jgi:hypothetical protein